MTEQWFMEAVEDVSKRADRLLDGYAKSLSGMLIVLDENMGPDEAHITVGKDLYERIQALTAPKGNAR